MTRDECLDRDARDDLAPLRDLFDLPENCIYLDGNSLGAQPKSAPARARALIEEQWGRQLIQSWNTAGWFDLPRRLGDRIAPLIGARAGEVVVTDTTSVNLVKALAAALAMTPGRSVIVSERANFPTDLYMAEGLAGWLGRGHRLHLVDSPAELPAAIDADCAVLLLTHVNYRSGYQHDMAALCALARRHGVVTVWDLAHSAGAVELDLTAAQADLAVGCTYKYLNGGPGAPAFIWVRQGLQQAFRQPLSGWWSHAAPFAMDAAYAPCDGIGRALCGTQPIVSLALIECGLEIFERTSIKAIRAKSLALEPGVEQLVYH